MKDDDAISQSGTMFLFMGLLCTIIIIMTLVFSVDIFDLDYSERQQYTENITIKSAYHMRSDSLYYIIVSTNNTEYLTRNYGIYTLASGNPGQDVNIVYIAEKNNECMIISMNFVNHNTTRCNVDTCGGVPIESDIK